MKGHFNLRPNRFWWPLINRPNYTRKSVFLSETPNTPGIIPWYIALVRSSSSMRIHPWLLRYFHTIRATPMDIWNLISRRQRKNKMLHKYRYYPAYMQLLVRTISCKEKRRSNPKSPSGDSKIPGIGLRRSMNYTIGMFGFNNNCQAWITFCN